MLANFSIFAQLSTDFDNSLDSKKEETEHIPLYDISWKKELPIYSGALGLQLAGIAAINKIEPLSLQEIELLRPENINSILGDFDRNTVKHFSAGAQSASDYVFLSSVTYPFLLLLDKDIRRDGWEVSLMASEAFLLNAGLTTLVKGTVKRVRPYAYNPSVNPEDKQNKTTQTSFFSGHTSTVSVMAFFSAKVYSDYNPDSKWKPVVWTAAALLPAATGYWRYKAGKHYPTDVLVGYGVGAAIGVLVPHLHRNKKHKNFRVSPMVGDEVVGLSLRGVF